MIKPIFTAVVIFLNMQLAIPFDGFSVKSKLKPNQSWIRVNLLGYLPSGTKVAVLASKTTARVNSFSLIDAVTGKVAYTSNNIKYYGAYGPFNSVTRLHFTDFRSAGTYYVQAGNTRSPKIRIGPDVYKNSADFVLRYMRQQRSGYNPFLKDSCHTRDGFVIYGKEVGIADSTFHKASGGWHDASDYLQYSTTSANATYHLLAAYRDFPRVFSDAHAANGDEGANGTADILDEARWGINWLLKMHPAPNWMFNQIADDRDHISMRIPKEDYQYGRGSERPLYFINGKPQQRGKFLNNTTGTSSTAAKFASAFGLGHQVYKQDDPGFAKLLREKAMTAYAYAGKIPGVTQTASVKSPYIYAEENWVDDMGLASAVLSSALQDKKLLDDAYHFITQEPVTPWMGRDTAAHYQFYPFHNFGHLEIARQDKGMKGMQVIQFYKQGIEKVWNKARDNGFFRGIPYIWCSNNLTVSFAIQAFLFKQMTGDHQYDELAQANFDWLFGCNIWGTSMVYGLPTGADTPADPHSAFTHLGPYPIDGGLVDGPVYGSIYNSLIGIKLTKPDEYAEFQSQQAVYHDDYGDYSTNEPTMDGTASLVYLLAAYEHSGLKPQASQATTKTPLASASTIKSQHGALIRGHADQKRLALVFTGDEFGDGGIHILKTLKKHGVKGSFFLTGRFYRNPKFKMLIRQLVKEKHYLGAHSDQHLLYCDWKKRDSLLITKEQFANDLRANYQAMAAFGIRKDDARFFLPPFEWHNSTIAGWTREQGLSLINFTPGTLSHADYTYPGQVNYRSSTEIYGSIVDYEQKSGLNGFLLLMHIGTDQRRKDKFYGRLDELISKLKQEGYELATVDQVF